MTLLDARIVVVFPILVDELQKHFEVSLQCARGSVSFRHELQDVGVKWTFEAFLELALSCCNASPQTLSALPTL